MKNNENMMKNSPKTVDLYGLSWKLAQKVDFDGESRPVIAKTDVKSALGDISIEILGGCGNFGYRKFGCWRDSGVLNGGYLSPDDAAWFAVYELRQQEGIL